MTSTRPTHDTPPTSPVQLSDIPNPASCYVLTIVMGTSGNVAVGTHSAVASHPPPSPLLRCINASSEGWGAMSPRRQAERRGGSARAGSWR
jgi:hypothetical protein